MYILIVPFQRIEASFNRPRIRNRFHWSGLRGGKFGGAGKGVAMDESVSRSSSLDFAQALKVTSLEVASAMLKLP